MVMMASLNIVRVWVQITMRIGVPGCTIYFVGNPLQFHFLWEAREVASNQKDSFRFRYFRSPHLFPVPVPMAESAKCVLELQPVREDERRSPDRKKSKQEKKEEKRREKRKRRQRRKPRRMKDERNRQSIDENKLPTHHIGHTQTPRRKQSPLWDETPWRHTAVHDLQHPAARKQWQQTQKNVSAQLKKISQPTLWRHRHALQRHEADAEATKLPDAKRPEPS